MLSFKKNNFLIILLLFVEIVFSQQFLSKNVSTIDGLPNNSVYSVYKDSRGILWVGTGNGLSALQNGKVSNFFVSDGLAHNSCWAILEDRNHNMWFGSHGGGLNFYDGKKFTIINQEKGLINNKIRRLFIHKNLLYIGTESGVSVLDIKTRKIILSKKIRGRRNLFQVMDFVEVNSKIYFGTFNDGFWRIDLEAKSIKLINHKQPDIFSIHKVKDSLLICHSDTINGSLSKISIKDYLSNRLSKNRFGSTVFWDYATDKRGVTYFAGSGINFASGGVFRTVKNKIKNVNKEFGIESSEIWSLFYDDKRDILYLGTTNKGLFAVDLSEQIKYYPATFYNKQKLDIVALGTISDIDLVLHKGGLLLFQKNKIQNEINNKKFQDFAYNSFKNNPQLEKYKYQVSFSKARLEGFEVRGLKIINSIIWINSTIGLFGVNAEGKIKEYYPHSTSTFDFVNNNKILFQIAYGRFCTVDDFRNNSGYKEYDSNNLNYPKDAFAILAIDGKYYIVSSSSGLYTYQSDVFYSYYFNRIWNENEFVQAKMNEKKQLVLANAFGDIFVIDVSNKFKIINKIDRKQLIGNSISFLECYKDVVFIGTEKGLNIYKNGSIRLIDEEQGLTSKAFTSSNVKGTVLTIGTQNGFFKFDFKNYISVKNSSREIKITAIDVNFQTINKFKFQWLNYASNEIVLPYDKNTISITFEPQNAQYPDKLQYRYRVMGLQNSNWSKWIKDKNINLTYLPNGSFKIRLETKDLFLGTVSSNDILKIVITPPFWKTWWFLLSSFALVSIGIYLIYLNRIRRIKSEEQSKSEIHKRLVETKMEALQSQMNPHFIFNAMNSIQNFIIDNNTDDALMYMGEFSKIIRQTLHNSSKQRIILAEEIEYLKSYITLENMRFQNQVTIEFSIDTELDLFEIDIPPMLIQPFVENVFVHAFDSHSVHSKLILSFKQKDNFLFCQIVDNGKGMISGNLNKLHTSKGIDLAKERIALFQVENSNPIEIFSILNEGTTIVIKLQID